MELDAPVLSDVHSAVISKHWNRCRWAIDNV